jgi:hypothetical protein
MELVPRQGVMVLPEAEEALEGDDAEGDLAAYLLDNEAFDFADVMASFAVKITAVASGMPLMHP